VGSRAPTIVAKVGHATMIAGPDHAATPAVGGGTITP
jgi:hypothetical protein